MQWETRTHWIWGFFVPGQWYLFFFVLEWPLTILALKWWGLLISAIVAMPFLVFCLTGLLDVWVKWTGFSLSISPTGKAILERHGFRVIAERRINLNTVGTLTFKQTPMGRVLDYGSLSIGALGGPYEWKNLGNFRALRRIIETQGEWMPGTRLNILRRGFDWMNLILLRVFRILRGAWQTISNYLQQLYVRHINNQATPSYSRFLHFAETILFDQNNRQRENVIKASLTQTEIQLYYRILRIRKVIITNLQGQIQRHQRIQTTADLRRHIPVDWFNRALKTI